MDTSELIRPHAVCFVRLAAASRCGIPAGEAPKDVGGMGEAVWDAVRMGRAVSMVDYAPIEGSVRSVSDTKVEVRAASCVLYAEARDRVG